LGDKIEMKKLAEYVAIIGGGEVCTVLWWGNLRERDQWGDPSMDGRTIIRWIFRKWDAGHEIDLSGSGKGQVAGTCECGNEHSGYIK